MAAKERLWLLAWNGYEFAASRFSALRQRTKRWNRLHRYAMPRTHPVPTPMQLGEPRCGRWRALELALGP